MAVALARSSLAIVFTSAAVLAQSGLTLAEEPPMRGAGVQYWFGMRFTDDSRESHEAPHFAWVPTVTLSYEHQLGPVRPGLAVAMEQAHFATSLRLGALLGTHWFIGSTLYSVHLEGGVHFYDEIGGTIVSRCSAGDCGRALPYLGARAALQLDLGRPGGWVWGAWLSTSTDLGSHSADVIVTSSLSPTASEESYELGGHSISGGLRLGFVGPSVSGWDILKGLGLAWVLAIAAGGGV